MQINGEATFDASREMLWAALNDPAVLQRCLPGCEEMQANSETEFTGRISINLGLMKASFKGQIDLSDLDPPSSYRLSGSGDGGLTGYVKGTALVTLTKLEADKTRLTYAVDPSVGGTLARLGQRLLRSSIQKVAEQFYAELQAYFQEKKLES